MPYPSKQKELYTILLQLIEANYPPGSKLPTERLLAQKAGVARMTLRKALDQLVFEKRIVKKPRGIFVADPDTGLIPHEDRKKTLIHILVPCPDLFAKIDSIAYNLVRDMIRGAMKVAVRYDTNVVTLPASENNDSKNINWENFSRLRKDDIVLFAGDWYRKMIPLLSARKCKTGIIINGLRFIPKHLRSDTSCRIYSRAILANYLPDVLQHIGRKKKHILLFLLEDYSLSLQSYSKIRKRDMLKSARATAAPSTLELCRCQKNTSFTKQCAAIREQYRKKKFDVLIFDGKPDSGMAASLHQLCALPDDVQIYVRHGELLNGTASQRANLFFTRSPFQETAEKMAEYFLSGAETPDAVQDFEHPVMDEATAWQIIRQTT